jgi:hypothetical protein
MACQYAVNHPPGGTTGKVDLLRVAGVFVDLGRLELDAQRLQTGDELRACMDAGADPSCARTKAVARRARSMIRAFAQDDPRVLEALARIRATAPPRDLAGWDPALMRYLDAALATPDKETDEV